MSDQLQAIRKTLTVLREYYADRAGVPHPLNATQIAVYLDGLGKFAPERLEAAARQHMRQSQFFPKLSELLAILEPKADLTALAHTAWARLEREIRRLGAYRNVDFEDAAFGEAVKQVFGSWASACTFDIDSPGWAIRRQTFLQIFPTLAARTDLAPVRLYGLVAQSEPAIVGHIEGLPHSRVLAAPDRSREVLAEVTRRASLAAAGERE